MIRDFTPRLYQQTILASAIEKNTLVVLPTGLGKTYIFLMLAVHRLTKLPESKILLLGPTRPLINQYFELFAKHIEIPKEEMAVFTGHVKPEAREELWKRSKIIFSTPQGLENDIISGRIKLEEVSLLGFDEAHRAVGEYSYCWIAKQYARKSKMARIIGMTASPGSDLETITEVCTNLHIEDVEIRTESDPDVRPYVQEVNVKWVYVELPSHFKQIQKYLNDCYSSKIASLQEYYPKAKELVRKSDILMLQSSLLKEISSGNKDISTLKAISILAEIMKLQHAIELLESQGISPLLDYMEGLVSQSRDTKVMAVKNLVQDLNFKSALIIARNLKEMKIEHPKYEELKKILSDIGQKKIIIFSQYRDSITNLVAEISKIPGIRPKMFVGQQKKKGTGMTQKEQISLVKEFREGLFNVLVMSSVGEEGLDIPSVDTVIFYEPIPSAIRTIQRRGRTGRHSEGEVIVLVTKGTRDEAYRWASFHKEKRMHDLLKELKKKLVFRESPDRKLTEFVMPDTDIVIHADHREKGSGIIKKLIELGINIKLEQLEIGDYILSPRLVVEYKTVEDFINSLLDKRLFTQLKDMKRYEKQLLIIEGSEDIFAQRKLHPNAVRGMLAAICIDYGVPIISTKTPDETALLFATIAKREQAQDEKGFTLHSGKPVTLKEQQEYIISSLPGIGPLLSKPLLKRFGSVNKVMNATAEELKEVELIGDKKAAKIREIVDSGYKD